MKVWNKGENNAGDEASLDIQIILGVCEIGLNKGDEIYIYNQSTSSLNDIDGRLFSHTCIIILIQIYHKYGQLVMVAMKLLLAYPVV